MIIPAKKATARYSSILNFKGQKIPEKTKKPYDDKELEFEVLSLWSREESC